VKFDSDFDVMAEKNQKRLYAVDGEAWTPVRDKSKNLRRSVFNRSVAWTWAIKDFLTNHDALRAEIFISTPSRER
jgi:hypothetical protein